MQRISIIAMDLDGTLLDQKGQISPDNQAALQECAARGVHIVLASGRSFEATRTFAMQMGVRCAIISCNGARLDESQEGNTLMEDCIPEPVARAVFQALRQAQVYFECYTAGRVYMMGGFPVQERFHNRVPGVTELGGRTLEYIESTERMEKEALKHAYKFVVHVPAEELRRRAMEQLTAACLPVDLTSSWHTNIEIMNRGAGKGRALKALAEAHGIAREGIMAFGDHLNDLSMFEAAGWPVAMENALDEVKAQARLIAPRHDESGVGRMVRAYVLGMKEASYGLTETVRAYAPEMEEIL